MERGADWRIDVVAGERLGAALDFAVATVDATPFQHPDWLTAWLDRFGGEAGRRPVMVEVRRPGGGEPVVRLPLSFERFSRVVRVWRPWDGGVCDYNGPIVARDFHPSRDEAMAIWRAIVAALPASDVVVVDKMPRRLGGRDNPFADLPGVHASFNRCHAVALGPDAAATRARFDGTMLRSLARKRRKLENKGRLVFDLPTGAEAEAAISAALGWRAARFAEANRGRETAALDGFFADVAARASIARVGRLRLDDRLLAAGLGTLTGTSFQLVVTGFDEAFKNWSPGLLMVEDIIAAAEAAGAEVFDFTIGAEFYKRDFGVAAEPLVDLFAARGLVGRLAVAHRLRRIAAMRAEEAARVEA